MKANGPALVGPDSMSLTSSVTPVAELLFHSSSPMPLPSLAPKNSVPVALAHEGAVDALNVRPLRSGVSVVASALYSVPPEPKYSDPLTSMSPRTPVVTTFAVVVPSVRHSSKSWLPLWLAVKNTRPPDVRILPGNTLDAKSLTSVVPGPVPSDRHRSIAPVDVRPA